MKQSDAGLQLFHGRRWLSVCLLAFAALCLALAVTTAFLGWFAALVMGLPALFAAYMCLAYGWGEWVARAELKDDRFLLRLPSYRGYFPFWPARRLEGKWSDVTGIGHCLVAATMLGVRFDYIAHRFETRAGSIVLLEMLANELSRDSRKSSLNLPVGAIAAEFARRAELVPTDPGRVRGGGLFRNILFGGPNLPI